MFLVNDLLRKVKLKLLLRKVKRHTLKPWLKLSDIQKQTQEAADAQDVAGVYHLLTEYVSAAIGSCPELPWVDFYILYGEIAKQNELDTKYPILRASDKEEIPLSWEYTGRSYYFWIHTLAKNFGWSINYIDNLEINTAVALLQEIEVEEQLQREFQWNMSEMAYSYDGTTSKHNPLTRPQWMLDDPLAKYKQQKRPEFDPRFMPIGNVVSVDVKH